MMLALLAFVGLAADGAILYVTYGQLRRSVDAAALAAAAQLREARTQTELDRSAQEVMRLQGLMPPAHIGADEVSGDVSPVDGFPDDNDGIDNDGDGCVDDPNQLCIRVETCQGLYSAVPTGFTDPLIANDPALCTYPPRKLVRVEGSTSAEFTFMRLWGWNRVQLNASAVSEAAALDVMLVLDASYSMTWDASLTNGVDDDGDGCIDEPAGEAGCGTPNGYADDWLGSKSSSNGLARPGIVDNPPAGPDVGDSLPDTTPNCTRTSDGAVGPDVTSAISALQAAGKLPANVLYDIDGSGSDDVLSPLTACRPFEYVRDAAVRFVLSYINFPYDRVGIVTFASAPCPPGRTYSTCSQNQTTVRQSLGNGTDKNDTLRALSIGGATGYGALSQLDVSSVPPCHGNFARRDLLYPNLWYGGQAGSGPDLPLPGAYGECENTDTGDGLKLAFQNLNANPRSNAVRFIILLSDGAASTSAYDAATFYTPAAYACPNDRLNAPSPYYDLYFLNRVCQDGDSRNNGTFRHASTDANYDSDDYARDQADAISLAGNTIIFTIGLGDAVTWNPNGGIGCFVNSADPDANGGNPDCEPNAEQLLRYIADKGDGINPPDPDPCDRDDVTTNDTYTLYMAAEGTSCGNYFYASGGLNVRAVFDQIAQRIFTRLTQ